MTKRKLFLITTAVLLMLTGIRVYWIILHAPPIRHEVVQGQLDMRNWDFTKESIISLDGQWEFFPYQLLMPSTIEQRAYRENIDLIQVPGNWKEFFPEEKSSHYGYGTYRMRILLKPKSEQSFSMRIPYIFSSSEVFVNGQSIGNKGHPATSLEHYETGVMPYTVIFSTSEEEIEILIHAANYIDNTKSGINNSIQFGTVDAINDRTTFSSAMQLLVVVFLLIQTMYVIILYIMGIRQRSLIYFALLMLTFILTVLLDDDMLLLNWIPLNYEWNIRMISVAFVGNCTFLLAIVTNLFPEYAKHRFFRWYFIHSVIMGIAFIVMPFSFTAVIGFNYFFVMMLTLLLVIVLTMRSTSKGGQDGIYLFLSACIIMLNGVGGIAKTLGGVQMGFYPVDIIVAFFIFSAFWFKQFFRVSVQTKKLAEKLQEADKQKDEFLANTSHELRNPLHGIINIAQSVLDNGKQTLSRKNIMNMELLINVSRRMSFMLNDLLDLMRLKEKGIQLQRRSLGLQNIAAGVCDMLIFMTEGKPIQLINAIPDTFPRVMADENRLIQILFNLLHNAVKYTDEGTIMIDAQVQNGKVMILITDTGIGMDLETQTRIFEAYERGDSGITSVGGGLGLGLGISKQLVELHGGTLEVISSLGQGAVFSFSLPLADPAVTYNEEESEFLYSNSLTEASTAVTADIAPSASLTYVDRPRILAVDDDPINLTVLVNILTLEQYEIKTVTSGKEALAYMDSNEWDLIIADVMMPHMSGYELSSIIRERFSISELPILLLTARSQPEDIEAGFHSGANDYVTKPVDAMELRSRVRILTELRKSIRERLRMEAAWLQAQIQPHFLFNTLNAIAALSDFDTVRMRVLLDEFGKYLRASFDFRNSERVVPLEHELGLVRSYLFIEQERFESRLNVHWEIDEGLTLSIPPLTIQPLVENAVRHGIMKKSQGGLICIRIKHNDTHVEVSIEDDGVGMDDVSQGLLLEHKPGQLSGIGLQNIDRRLKQIYGQGLRIHSMPGKGTIVSFIVSR